MNSSSLLHRLASYGTAAASATAATGVTASIVYFDIPDTTTPSTGARLIYFTPSNGTFALSPQSNSSAYQFVIFGGSNVVPLDSIRPNQNFSITPNSAVTLRSGPDVLPAHLTLGAVIGGAGQFAGPSGTLASGGFTTGGNFFRYGNWNAPPIPNSGYVGFRFGTTGDLHYGWADITINADYSVTLRGFAYESTAGATITAGAIPEPGAASLLLLGLGAGGMAAYRSRSRRLQPAA